MGILDMKSNKRFLAIFDELEASIRLIKLGLGELQNIDDNNNFYFLPFQLLSQGFERLMKVYLCIGHIELKNDNCSLKYIKDAGHDLNKLLQLILKEYFDTHNKPVIIDDKAFLENNEDFAELLNILSDFGRVARYHNIDIITNENYSGISPKARWIAFENRLISNTSECYDKLLSNDGRAEVYGMISRHITIIFEKYLSALGRQFLFNTLGSYGKQLSAQVMDFAMLYPNDFGKVDYRKHTTRYIQRRRKAHKRGVLDFWRRHFNRHYKHKKIYKRDYEEWPFVSDSVVIECRHNNWCIVSIDGYDYALNGISKAKYKLETPHEAGTAEIGKSISKFIDLAHKL